MAGEEKSSKSCFMNNSPKPKQASILSFFGTQKQQQISSSPLFKVIETKAEVTEETENVPFEFFEESLDFLEKTPKKVCIYEDDKRKMFDVKSYEVSGVIAPKILTELNEAAVCDFETSDGSCGRYNWLIDIRDINGNMKGLPK